MYPDYLKIHQFAFSISSSIPMVFRLPTHLDSFVPPPTAQISPTHPWRGNLTVSGMRASDLASNQELRVTAVESDGDRTEIWPTQLFVRIAHDRPILREAQSWIKSHSVPLSTFLPDRLRDPNQHAVNQTTFRSLSRILYENQLVAVAPWSLNDNALGGGIVFFPSENSSAILVGAVFLDIPIPDFIIGGTQPAVPFMPGSSHPSSQQPQQAHYHTHSSSTLQAAAFAPSRMSLPSISSSFRSHSNSPPGLSGYRGGSPTSPQGYVGSRYASRTPHSASEQRFQPIVPPSVPPYSATSATSDPGGPWGAEDEDLATFSPISDRSRYPPQSR